MDYLSVDPSFNSLSLPDLLAARDQFHLHLMNKANVVGTAVGRYLIRNSDPSPTAQEQQATAPRTKEPRTLENSGVRDYSWPAILVFVSKWVDDYEFGQGRRYPGFAQVPKTIYLPDGRSVPVCVILARADESFPPRTSLDSLKFPSKTLSCGYPVFADVQQQRHVASIGCLVTDGHTVYALTSRHVAGRPGEEIVTNLDGNQVIIGRASSLQIGKIPFEAAYDSWPGRHVSVNVDVGLIELADLRQWSSSIYGLGKLGPLADLGPTNLTLNLIGVPVRANGGVSGSLNGRIAALFYRYKSVGGTEYVADFLIGSPDSEPLRTQHGDSGSIWAIDGGNPETGWMPIAVQWGGATFATADSRLPFALATNLSTVCRELDVELYRGGVGSFDYWGAVGHYTIGSLACDLPINARLKTLMVANRRRISFDSADIGANAEAAGTGSPASPHFVPLADVPDKVWKARGGHGQPNPVYSRVGPENPNHYADMDYAPPGGQSLYDLTPDAASLNPTTWRTYYHDLGWDAVSERGMLPFRVWQLYKAMVGFVAAQDITRFVAAAGVLAHYVGDGCQPLHGSYLDDGDPFRKPDGTASATMLGHGKGYGHGVHSAYETDMLNDNTDELLNTLPGLLGANHGMQLIAGGSNAGFAVVELMKRTSTRIKPIDLVEAYVTNHSTSSLWQQFGQDTMTVIADGCKTLAMIWESAWQEGNGDAVPDSKIKAYSESSLQNLYEDTTFVPSVALGQIDQHL